MMIRVEFAANTPPQPLPTRGRGLTGRSLLTLSSTQESKVPSALATDGSRIAPRTRKDGAAASSTNTVLYTSTERQGATDKPLPLVGRGLGRGILSRNGAP